MGASATVLRYRAVTEAVGVVIGATESLFDWVQPHLPEDLAILASDDRPLFWSVAHERIGGVRLRKDQFDDLLALEPGMKDLFDAVRR